MKDIKPVEEMVELAILNVGVNKEVEESIADVFRVDRTALLEAVTEALEEVVGKKCDTYEEDCPACEIWQAIEKINKLIK